jgi:anti-anti-sigma factor
MHEHLPKGAVAPIELRPTTPTAEPLHIGIVVSGGAMVVTITGELDLAVAEMARARVWEAWEAHQRPMVLDLNGVTFIDSAGLRSLLKVVQELTAEGAAPTFAAVSHPVQRVLELSGTTALIASS